MLKHTHLHSDENKPKEHRSQRKDVSSAQTGKTVQQQSK